jgi:hypothetical protein
MEDVISGFLEHNAESCRPLTESGAIPTLTIYAYGIVHSMTSAVQHAGRV